MVDLLTLEPNSSVWMVSFEISKMLEPICVTFISPESKDTTKLALIQSDGKKVCHPSYLLFYSEHEAKIYGTVNFIKLYYSFDPFTVAEDISEDMVLNAHELLSYYEEFEPDRYLYYWMGYVADR